MSRNNYHVLIDSDAFVGWIFPKDAHHQQVKKKFQTVIENRLKLVTTNYVVGETATVLSKLAGQDSARLFLSRVKKITTIHISTTLHEKSLEVFSSLDKKRTSVIDCSNVAVMRQFSIPTIFSFDKVYAKTFGLDTL
ncbi:MAG: PIN domain-containing protein [Anaerolineales bacterium]|nr:PIN domain-containing protein [Anaerolineales bacterium]